MAPPTDYHVSKRSKFIRALDNLHIYLVLAVLFLAINAAIVACILQYVFFTNPGTQRSDSANNKHSEVTTPGFSSNTTLKATYSEATMNAALRMEKWMNLSADPCLDFFNYACGGWLALDKVRNSNHSLSVLHDLNSFIQLQIAYLIQTPPESDEPFYKTQIKKFFDVCKNTERLRQRGTAPFFAFLKTIGKFPLLDPSWNESDFNLQDLVTNLAKLGFPALFSVVSIESEIVILAPSAKSLQMFGKLYMAWTVGSLKLLGMNSSQPNVKDDLLEIFLLENTINDLKTNAERTFATYPADRFQAMNVSLLQNNVPWLNWLKFFQDITTGLLTEDKQITDKTTVFVEYSEFLATLHTNLTKKFSTRAMANYLMKSLLMFTVGLDTRFISFHAYVERQLGMAPPDSEMSRQQRCLHEASAVFEDSISRMYVDEFYNEDATTDITNLLMNLKKSYEEMISTVSWLSTETRSKLINKLHKMREKIAYPAHLKNDDIINTMYADIPTEEYFEVVPAVARWYFKKNLKRLNREETQIEVWERPPTTLSAYYALVKNTIAVPAAGLNGPFYDIGWTSSMKYGALGMVIGHEIMHGFDNNGFTFNGEGKQVQNYTLPEEIFAYHDKLVCFVEHYNSLLLNGVRINGTMTLGENLCDIHGLRASFKAYRRFIEGQGSEEMPLPSLNLTHNEIFFVNFAQTWCEKIPRGSMAKTQAAHAPGAVRVIGTLRNSKDFAEVFKCKPESPMNPEQKCSIF